MLKLGFIGAGTIGSALALKLSRRGYPVVAASSRRHTSAKRLAQAISGCLPVTTNQEVADTAELVFIATPDDVIASVATQVKWREGQMVVHCSGADSTGILEPARKAGAGVGVFHPLQTFAGAGQAMENMPGSTFTLEAEAPLLGILQEMANALGGRWIKLKPGDKAVYHAAAVMACNYLVTLVKMATDLWQTFGVPRKEATEALLPLIRGTVHNLETIGLPQCLTGPIARGDSGTIKKHLEALERVSPDTLSSYRELGLKTIPIALAKGRISGRQAEELRAALER
ncbi:MAG TPA: DUF2520 domain-containing protein [Dehalococcoidia bacterium]|nr:DUF2520 domain-containing protein [Dehalococcoidia bacterium]